VDTHWVLQCLAYVCEHASAKKSCLFLFTVTISHDLKFKILSPLDTFMPPALSVDIKKRIVELRHRGLDIRDIATQMKVSVGGVCKTFHTYEECDPSKKRTGRPQILDDDDAWYLKSLLESNPVLYLDQIKKKNSNLSAMFPYRSSCEPGSTMPGVVASATSGSSPPVDATTINCELQPV